MPESEALVFGLYRSEASLEYAICHLRNVGFLEANFSVVFPPPQADFMQASERLAILSAKSADALSDQNILLSVRCESSGQAVIAKKILECTEADSVLTSAEQRGSIQLRTEKFSNLA